MAFAAGFLFLLWVLVSILSNGIAILHRFTGVRGVDLFGYGVAAGVVLHAFVGCAIAIAAPARWVFLVLLIALTIGSSGYMLKRGVIQELFVALTPAIRLALALWGLLLLLGLGLFHLPIRFPPSLPDGPYIFKTDTLNVKIQYLTGLPADNYVPFAVAQFLLRGVSFKKERPILPGNEVSNRTILMSLVSLPFGVAMGVPHDHPHLGSYRYIDRDWPDVSKFYTDRFFEGFAIVGMFLNSLLLIGLVVFCSSLGLNSSLPSAALLYVTNPYFLTHTIFTWPKALAGFFILLGWTSIRKGHSPAVVGVLMALAYHSHPYAIVFAACAGLFYLMRWRQSSGFSSAVFYGLSFALLLAPWFIWTRLVLHIPSDLIAQNFAGGGSEEAWASAINFVWVRLRNFFVLVTPIMFAIYPFDARIVYDNSVICMPGVLGLAIILPALIECADFSKRWLWCGFIGPAVLILGMYSCTASVVLHGYQPLMGVLLFLGVWRLSQHFSRKFFVGLITLQLVMNLSLITLRGVISGVRF